MRRATAIEAARAARHHGLVREISSTRTHSSAALSVVDWRNDATWCRRVIATARAAGATEPILVRGDSAYGNSAVIGACLRAKVHFLRRAGQEQGGEPGDRRHR
jgi:hypothetical protein